MILSCKAAEKGDFNELGNLQFSLELIKNHNHFTIFPLPKSSHENIFFNLLSVEYQIQHFSEVVKSGASNENEKDTAKGGISIEPKIPLEGFGVDFSLKEVVVVNHGFFDRWRGVIF